MAKSYACREEEDLAAATVIVSWRSWAERAKGPLKGVDFQWRFTLPDTLRQCLIHLADARRLATVSSERRRSRARRWAASARQTAPCPCRPSPFRRTFCPPPSLRVALRGCPLKLAAAAQRAQTRQRPAPGFAPESVPFCSGWHGRCPSRSV